MSFKPGDRVRATRGQSRTDGTVKRVIPGEQIPLQSGEVIVRDPTIVVEWDHIPGATTAAQRTNSAPAGALERAP